MSSSVLVFGLLQVYNPALLTVNTRNLFCDEEKDNGGEVCEVFLRSLETGLFPSKQDLCSSLFHLFVSFTALITTTINHVFASLFGCVCFCLSVSFAEVP